MKYTLLASDTHTLARAGLLETARGPVETPAFMPVGTQATVKGLTPDVLRSVGARLVLANTYHLALRPGEETVAALGGLHAFMAWDGPILTDSGGFQVFSLAARRDLNDEGVTFRSHIDGRRITLTPARAIAIQEALGADIIMCFDHCPALPATRADVADATARTLRWALVCKSVHTRPDQALFGIVQGGTHADLRRECAEALVALDFPGYAVGGVSVGESREEFLLALEATTPSLPTHKPRYLMGVGRPEDLLMAVARGIDMFDCVLPTRNGRNATCLSSQGPVRLRNARYRLDPKPIDESCRCPVCARFSRAYLRHLFMADEMLGPILASTHNLAFLHQLMHDARRAIVAGTYAAFMASVLEMLGNPSVG